jgi:hypothetical protein
MKYEKIFDNVTKALLIPLWIALLIEPAKEYHWIFYTAFCITTLLLLVYLILGIHRLRLLWDSYFNNNCRRIDAIIQRTQKKLLKIITKTSSPSVLDYAHDRLREICPHEIYDHITKNQGKKGQRSYNRDLLSILKTQTGGINENKNN